MANNFRRFQIPIFHNFVDVKQFKPGVFLNVSTIFAICEINYQ